MLETAAAPAEANADAQRQLTDGFHLVIEALRLNDVKTIYGVPGIPITDFGRLAQAAGIRVIDRKSTRLNSSHIQKSRMPSSA